MFNFRHSFSVRKHLRFWTFSASRYLVVVCVALMVVTSAARTATAANDTITVDTVEDVVDFGGAQQIGDLPGSDGRISFREACTAANNTAGPQTIEFAIAASDWWLFDDRALLKLEDGPFVITGDATTLDFRTQTDFTGDTNPDGWEVGIYGLQANGWGITAMFILADDCLIMGLDRVMLRGYGLEIGGNNNRVISCTISGSLYAGVKVQGIVGDPATGNIIGGILPGEGNVLSGGNSAVRVDGPCDGTVIIGNTFVGSPYAGVEVRGAYCCPDYTPHNTRIGGPTPEERNWIANNGGYGEEGFPQGNQVHIEWAVNTTVEGNYIGTTEDGSERFPNAHGIAGVSVRESDGTVIRNNLVSGLRRAGINHAGGQVFGVGIRVVGLDTGVVIQGNQIGTDVLGENPIPNHAGVFLGWFQGSPSLVQFGGSLEGDANLVAFNELYGIAVGNEATGVTFDRNSIHSNGELGIDLLPDSRQYGPTPNDVGDSDTGGNGLQNYPVIGNAVSSGTSIAIDGTLNSTSNTAFTIQFFASESCDASGFGEGALFLGETMLITDGSGNAGFDVSLPAAVPPGWVLTSTATPDVTGSTSEFSACIPIQVNSFTANSFTITRGVYLSGTVFDLSQSDNSDVTARRSPSDISSRVFLEIEGFCPMQIPPVFEFALEASVFARAIVVQSIDFYNFDSDRWEEVDTRDAARFSDSTTIATATGDLSRFVEDGTNRVKARCRYESANQRQQFSANVDHTMWTISN